jgi:membrane carboxypeptidase/penicillin-binding protein PbpC
MTTLNETIADAQKVMIANNLTFATIWKTGKSYGFNFDKQAVGYSVKEYGVKRTVVSVINK